MKRLTNRKSRLGRCLLLLSVALTVSGPSFAQEVSEEEIERYKEIKKAAKKEKVEEVVQQDKTGTDPRVFSDKFMPYYRYTKLENGLTQQDLTAFGTVAFSPVVGMIYELPLAQYRDFSDVPGLPAMAPIDAIGMGDIDLKFWSDRKPWIFTTVREERKAVRCSSALITFCLRQPMMRWPATPSCSRQ